MSKRTSRPPGNDSESPVEVLIAKYGLFGTVVTALLGVVGVGLTAYLGYLGIRAQIEAPIIATQTAENRLYTPSPPSPSPSATSTTSTVPATASPTSHIYFTPYQDAFIEIIFANPDPKQPLTAAEDVRYSYKIRYFVPEFDWKGSGIEPHVQLERIVNHEAGLETVVLNDIVAEIGKARTIDVDGRFIVPSDRKTWGLRLKIIFLTNDGGGMSGGNLVLPIQYSILKSP